MILFFSNSSSKNRTPAGQRHENHATTASRAASAFQSHTVSVICTDLGPWVVPGAPWNIASFSSWYSLFPPLIPSLSPRPTTRNKHTVSWCSHRAVEVGGVL